MGYDTMPEIDELLASLKEIDQKMLKAPPGIATHEDVLDLAERQNVHLQLILGVQKGMIAEIREMLGKE